MAAAASDYEKYDALHYIDADLNSVMSAGNSPTRQRRSVAHLGTVVVPPVPQLSPEMKRMSTYKSPPSMRTDATSSRLLSNPSPPSPNREDSRRHEPSFGDPSAARPTRISFASSSGASPVPSRMSLGRNPALTRQESMSSLRRTRTWVHKYEYGSEPEADEMRARLRSHPAVVKALRLWWQTAVKTIRGGRASLFDDPNRGLNKEQYIQVSRKMYKALYAVWDPDDAEEAALEDWERDSATGATVDTWGSNMGERVLGGDLFMDAMFELADTWTYGASPELYAGFLNDLFEHIAIGTPPNAFFWKRDEDIAYGGFECGAEPSEQRASRREATAAAELRGRRVSRVSLPPLTDVPLTAEPPQPPPEDASPKTPRKKAAPGLERKSRTPGSSPRESRENPGFHMWKRMVGAHGNYTHRLNSGPPTPAGARPSTMPRLANVVSAASKSPRPGSLSDRSGLSPDVRRQLALAGGSGVVFLKNHG